MTEHAIQNARAHLESIHGARLACDWLLSTCRDGNDLNDTARALLREHGWPEDSEDDVAEAIRDDLREAPLSVDVRSGWQAAGETLEPAEFQITLSTGGPALRVVGNISTGGDPLRCRLEWRDWGTPWTEHQTRSAEDESLEWFAGLFWFEVR